MALVPLFVTFEKWETHQLLQRLRSKGYGTRRAVILGTDGAARRIYTALVRSPKFGVEPVAFVRKTLRALPKKYLSVPIIANIRRTCSLGRCVQKSFGNSTRPCS